MPEDAPRPAQAAIRTDLGAIFVSMELSRRAWLITSLSPGGGEKMSKHWVPASDVSGLLRRFAELRRKAAVRTGRDFPIIVIQEAGLDGFWIHLVLQSEGIESHVVDAASILTSRRGRRAKTERSGSPSAGERVVSTREDIQLCLGRFSAVPPNHSLVAEHSPREETLNGARF
jgi:transposase